MPSSWHVQDVNGPTIETVHRKRYDRAHQRTSHTWCPFDDVPKLLRCSYIFRQHDSSPADAQSANIDPDTEPRNTHIVAYACASEIAPLRKQFSLCLAVADAQRLYRSDFDCPRQVQALLLPTGLWQRDAQEDRQPHAQPIYLQLCPCALTSAHTCVESSRCRAHCSPHVPETAGGCEDSSWNTKQAINNNVCEPPWQRRQLEENRQSNISQLARKL